MIITVTIGKSGRLVVPKEIRSSLGLHEGSRLRLEVAGGRIEAVPVANTELRIEDGFPVLRGPPGRKRGDIVKAIKAEREARSSQLAGTRARP